ncbi:UDP-3-O-acyl-N-acetylglucosamine deacetylase [Alienimonas californiensis]|uniref:UDP-3-O-acyl-N-acetylglucosamine deacetylase n=1 Tax=Alienimonas californiensis TaxID=2527989 RepID=A0A517PDP8_9PLAN|nr:UDP-3-O-acyl-N-acetylglucosamine deacetylase [Alienimonas californiensis]QDT17494.1 UDP-3-O-[3-hydroxymyristoyl] N-acetylglucosamine deacetylase [Alienimonas californiensis]
MTRSQTTLAADAELSGVAFFTGGDVRVRFRPAPADSGVVFVRTDLPGQPSVPATIEHALELHRRTGVRRGAAEVQLTEHVLAALAGLRIDNCRVEIDGPELPGLDGSALGFVQVLQAAGVRELAAPRAVLRVLQPITVTAGEAALTASPPGGDGKTQLEYRLDCGPDHPVPSQLFRAEIAPAFFAREIAPARTFIAAAEIPALRAAGYGERVDAADLLVFEPDGTVRGNAPRFENEPARHKLLDMIGDLALLGCELHAAVASRKGGHALNRDLCRTLRTAAARGDTSIMEGIGVSTDPPAA